MKKQTKTQTLIELYNPGATPSKKSSRKKAHSADKQLNRSKSISPKRIIRPTDSPMKLVKTQEQIKQEPENQKALQENIQQHIVRVSQIPQATDQIVKQEKRSEKNILPCRQKNAFEYYHEACVAVWKNTMTNEEKLPFERLAEQDKQRYDQEMKLYNQNDTPEPKEGPVMQIDMPCPKKQDDDVIPVNEQGDVISSRNKNFVEAIEVLKREKEQPKSSKQKKIQEKDDNIQKLQPKRALGPYQFFLKNFKSSGKGGGAGSHAREVAARWNQMTEDEKKPYELESQKDRKRKERQDKEQVELGYFTLDDGTKSTDISVTKKSKSPIKHEENKEPRKEKKRGRPKKILAEDKVKKEPALVGQKRGRGRPRKEQAIVHLLNEDEIVQVVDDVKKELKKLASKGKAQTKEDAQMEEYEENLKIVDNFVHDENDLDDDLDGALCESSEELESNDKPVVTKKNKRQKV